MKAARGDLVFIVGMPRSGTKLLRDLLSQHSKVAIFPNESHFIPYLARKFHSFGDITREGNFRRIYQEFADTTFYSRISAKGVHIRYDDLLRRLNGSSYRSFLEAMFDCYREISGKKIVGDKTPAYITQIPLLSNLFPNAKFIHIYRDPRDYAISIHNAWGKNRLRAVQRWKDQIRKLVHDVNDHGVLYHSLTYEQLVSDTESALSDVCSYLSIDVESAMLALKAPAENLGDARGQSQILSDNFNKWRVQLPPQEIHRIESIVGKLAYELGYNVDNRLGDSAIPWILNRFYYLSDVFNMYRFEVREQGGVIPALRLMRRSAVNRGVVK